MMPTASPAPFLVERNTTSVPRKAKKSSKGKQKKTLEFEMDQITHIAPDSNPYSDDDDDLQKPDGIKIGEESAGKAEMTAGVQKIEDVTRAWSPVGIAVCWTGMFLLAIALTLDTSTISSYQPYALSQFQEHSMLPAISTLQNIL